MRLDKTTRGWLSDLYALIDQVPFPNDGSGTQTATMAGFVAYQADMRVFLPAFRRALYGILMVSHPNVGELEEGHDYIHPDRQIAAIKRWVGQRSAAGWALPVPGIVLDEEKAA